MSISDIYIYLYQSTHYIIHYSYPSFRCTRLHISITHYVSSNIRLLCSTAWHQLTTPAGPSPYISCSFTAGDMPADNCPWPYCRWAFVYFISWALVGGQLYPASSIWDIADVPYIFRRRNSPDISAHVQQPSLLNIDLHSTIREQQVQTSNIISTDKYNPVQVIHQIHVNTSNATLPPPPQHKRALNKEQFEVKPLSNLKK